MNRYQLELMEMDRRHRLKVRIVYFVIGGLLVVCVAWNLGLSPVAAWKSVSAWMLSEQASDREANMPALAAPGRGTLETTAELREPVDLLRATEASIGGSPQQIYLVETTPGRNPEEGSAKLGVDPRAPQTYVAGAILLNGARLAQIYRDYVVLERDGEQLRLELTNGLIQQDERAISDLAYVGGRTSPQRPAVETDRVSEILRMSPVYENDLLVGLQVYPGTRSSIFHQSGLRPGDIVLAVDGAPVFDAAASWLFDPLVHGASMTLTIRRDSQVHTLSVGGYLVSESRTEDVYSSDSASMSPSG